tara:strand:+ start:1483 stop:1629 length:147 start_codon:yes stop_codon:yes gene_type:complete
MRRIAWCDFADIHQEFRSECVCLPLWLTENGRIAATLSLQQIFTLMQD